VCIAMALLNRPRVVIADEPTTALDATTQAQILGLVRTSTAVGDSAFIWITHDLAVVSQIADRIGVMYAGQIVEEGPAERVINTPLHPYTRGLLDSIPARNRGRQRLRQIPGVAPALDETRSGCRFLERCEFAETDCRRDQVLVPQGSGRGVRCWKAGTITTA